MKELGTVNNHLRNSLKDIDFAAIEKDAAAMKAIFAVVLTYWQDKKVDDAIKLSQDGIKAATRSRDRRQGSEPSWRRRRSGRDRRRLIVGRDRCDWCLRAVSHRPSGPTARWDV